jgi:acyl-CoA synthetase (AMP-forming)/AMP-acid ligase II
MNKDLPALKTMTQAGGKLSPELHKEFAQYAINTGKRFFVMYGQTEATARMAYLPSEKSLEKYGSMGVAIPGGRLSLVDEKGREIVAAGEVGELVYYGKNVALGYAESCLDLANGDEWQGRLLTGDMAKRDEDGYYYIVGRKKRFLKIFGNRVNLDEIDIMLKTEFPALDIASGGKDDKMKLYVAGGKGDERISQLVEFLAIKTGLNRSAFEIVEVLEIPRSESGKPLYSKLEGC